MENRIYAEEERLLTFAEAGKMLSMNPRSLYQARMTGQLLLPVVALSPRNLRIRLSDVRAAIGGLPVYKSGGAK